MIKAVVVPASDDETMRVIEFDENDIDAMQEVVGGYVQAILGQDQGLTFFCNEEAKIHGLPVNRRATLALWSADFAFFERDALLGDVLVTGLYDDEGNTLAVPEEFIELLFNTAEYKPEFLAGSDKTYATNSMRFTDWLECINHAASIARRWQLVYKFRVSAA